MKLWAIELWNGYYFEDSSTEFAGAFDTQEKAIEAATAHGFGCFDFDNKEVTGYEIEPEEDNATAECYIYPIQVNSWWGGDYNV